MRGRRPVVTLLPDAARPDVLAVLYRGPEAPPTRQDRALHAGLETGVRDRNARPAGPAVGHVLRRAAESEGCWLHALPDGPGLRRLAQALPGDDGALLVPGATVLALGGYRDLPLHQLRAGQAMQRALLTARARGPTAAAVAADAPIPGLGPCRGLRPQLLIVVEP